MRTTRINTPLNKRIDEWLFHFNGKAVKFDVHMKRKRDPEQVDSHGVLAKLATFHAYLDRKYLRDHDMSEKELGFPLTPVSGDSYNDVFERVKDMVWSAKDQVWETVIAVAVSGVERLRDEDKVKFAWGVGLRSKDGTLFKTMDSRNYVSRRSRDIIPGSVSFEQDSISVYPYTLAMEESLRDLDAMFANFTNALKFAVGNPDVLLSLKNRLLLTAGEPHVTPVDGEASVSGTKL